jgi:hypothetical protein
MTPKLTTSEATARPWRWLPNEGQFIVANYDRIVAEIPCQGCNAADGELIVRAVNCFDDLLAACHQVIRKWGAGPSHLPVGERNRLLVMLCEAANKAEGKS